MTELFYPPRRPVGWEHRFPLTPAEELDREEFTERLNSPPVPSEHPKAYTPRPFAVEPTDKREPRLPLTPGEQAIRDDEEKERIRRMSPPEIAYTRGTKRLLLSDRYILRCALQERSNIVNLGHVLNGWQNRRENQGKTQNALYQEIYRGFNRLSVHGLGTVGKMDGLVTFEVDRSAVLTLIRWNTAGGGPQGHQLDKGFKQNSNHGEKTPKYDYLAIENITNQRRQAVVNYLHGIKWIDRYDRNYINNRFLAYDSDVTQKVIALLSDTGDIIGMQYSTRFNDTRKSAIALKKYDYAVDKSYTMFSKAIYITLTTSPNDHENIWQANRSFSSYWNKFMSAMTKRLGRRPRYISAFEFSPKKGLMHCHAMIFIPQFKTLANTSGLSYRRAVRKRAEELSEMWERISRAFIVDYQEVERKKTREGKLVWSWRDPNPKDTRGKPIKETVTDYLKKYMKKAILSVNEPNPTKRADTQALYWAFNKRFWTCSRVFNPKPEEEEDLATDSPRYVFLGVFWDNIALEIVDTMVYYRGGENPNIDYEDKKDG